MVALRETVRDSLPIGSVHAGCLLDITQKWSTQIPFPGPHYTVAGREMSLLITGRIRNGRIIDREREGLKKVNLAWDAVILNFLMAVCGLSAVLVTGSVHVRTNGVPDFAKLQSFSARLSALER